MNATPGGASRAGVYGALSTIAGIFLSGPLAVALVQATHPQPPWGGAELFARSFHPLQLLPYLGGIFLVGGVVVLLAAVHSRAADGETKTWANAGLVFCAAFAALVFANYVLQTTVVPVLAEDPSAANGPLLALLSMANPRSLAWAIEMWGWGLCGVATALVAPAFGRTRVERLARIAFVANGPVSVLGAVLTVSRPGWPMTVAGLIVFALWNLLLLAMAILALLAFRRVAPAPRSSVVPRHAANPV
jgi:hypothetical protein